MRLFIAATLPPADVFTAVTRDLCRITPGVKPVPAGNWHVTLRFLGETDDRLGVIAAMQQALTGAAVVPASVCGVGAFPDAGAARVAWAAVDAPGLHVLAATLGRVLDPIGFPADHRPFLPHVTLARLSRPHDVSFWVQQHGNTVFFNGNLDEVVLFSSESTRRGSVYTRLAVVTLFDSTS